LLIQRTVSQNRIFQPIPQKYYFVNNVLGESEKFLKITSKIAENGCANKRGMPDHCIAAATTIDSLAPEQIPRNTCHNTHFAQMRSDWSGPRGRT